MQRIQTIYKNNPRARKIALFVAILWILSKIYNKYKRAETSQIRRHESIHEQDSKRDESKLKIKQLNEKINELNAQIHKYETTIRKYDDEATIAQMKNNVYNKPITDVKMENIDEEKQEEKKEETLNIEMKKLEESMSTEKNLSRLATLDVFGHKYSETNLNKCDKNELIKMIQALYLSKGNYEKKLKENVLGVGSENAFLDTDEIDKKYHELKTQKHRDLHDNLCDELEKKYNDSVKDEVIEKESYKILFPILNLSNQQISQEFENLYIAIAKMLKINQQKNANTIVSNVLHSTLQTYYESLVSTVDNDNDAFFDFNTMATIVYKQLLEKYSNGWMDKGILNCIEKDVSNYIKDCLEMIVIIQLHKPKLHFDYLNEFENNINELFDGNKHDKSNTDCDDEDEKLEITNNDFSTKCIRYYYFPGLKIQNSINMKGNKKEKRKKDKDKQYTIICKTQVVC